jgi:hypothetical protein
MPKYVFSFELLGALDVLAGTALAAGGGTPRVAKLTGASEVPAADTDGSGTAVIRVNHGKKRVCWQLSVSGIGAATAAHIHKAAAGVNGPVVVALSAPDGTTGKASGCATVTDRALLKDLIKKPGDYYVNVHNVESPGGAVRGQLGKPGGSSHSVKPGKPVKPA